jgi:hypothetical protein
MNRPTESDYVSHVAYTRALEEYCNKVEPTSADYAMGFAEGFNEGCRPRPWQGLTDEEIWEIHDRCIPHTEGYVFPVDFARAIEAAHGIKEGT